MVMTMTSPGRRSTRLPPKTDPAGQGGSRSRSHRPRGVLRRCSILGIYPGQSAATTAVSGTTVRRVRYAARTEQP